MNKSYADYDHEYDFPVLNAKYVRKDDNLAKKPVKQQISLR